MEKKNQLPFKVGDLAEAISFQVGYRSAWFRCKIKEISYRNGHAKYALEYYDFPDEKIKWTKLYQLPPNLGGKGRDTKRQLMVRPHYPPIYHESQMPDISTISEGTVIIDGIWKVGDLVDWLTDGCYWSGTLTKLFSNGKALIELISPPIGEGGSYEISLSDVRPSLHWSPQFGWTLPASTDDKNSRCCARLIQPLCQALHDVPPSEVHEMDRRKLVCHTTTGSQSNASVSTGNSVNSLAASDELDSSLAKETLRQPLAINASKGVLDIRETNAELDVGGGETGKASRSYSDSDSCFLDTPGQIAGEIAEDLSFSSCLPKKFRSSREIPFNAMNSDALEAAILDLEELANKVRWLKGILHSRVPLSGAVRPSWRFIEHHAPSVRK